MQSSILRWEPGLNADVSVIISAPRRLELFEAEAAGHVIGDEVLNWCALSAPHAYVVYRGPVPVFVFGAAPLIPGVVQLWGIGTEGAQRALPSVGRFIREFFRRSLIEAGVRRAQVHVPVAASESWTWLQRVGLRVEAVFDEMCQDGSPMMQLVYTRKDYFNDVSFSRSEHFGSADAARPTEDGLQHSTTGRDGAHA